MEEKEIRHVYETIVILPSLVTDITIITTELEKILQKYTGDEYEIDVDDLRN